MPPRARRSRLSARREAFIASPVANITYAFGQKVAANYNCRDAQGGPGMSSCSGTVGNGSPIDTKHVGQHTFTVTAKSADGLTAKTVVHYTVRPNNQFDASDVKAGSGGSVSFSFKVPGPGKLSVVAMADSATYGSGSKNVSTGQGTFTVQPNSTGKSLLQKNPHGVKVRLFITFTPTGRQAANDVASPPLHGEGVEVDRRVRPARVPPTHCRLAESCM